MNTFLMQTLLADCNSQAHSSVQKRNLIHLINTVNKLSNIYDVLGITDDPDLYVSDALHRAVVDVNEEGTEAAAATSAKFMRKCFRVYKEDLRCNHPFMFLIRARKVNESDSTIYFIGRLAKPTSEL